jgi:O-antigen ligase
MTKSPKTSSGFGTNSTALSVVIWAGALTTLLFSPALYDPFNAPKSWVLSIAGAWLLVWVIFNVRGKIKDSPLKWATILSLAFLLALTSAFLATDNAFTGFFGEYQRRTGYQSYFALIVIFLAACYLVRLGNIVRIERAGILVGFLLALYGFFQHFKLDFVHWNNPYNSVLSTLGNPDFAAAAMAIFCIISFGSAVQSKNPTWLRIIAISNTIFLFVVIGYSQVRQGIFAAIIGITLVGLVWLNQRKKSLAVALSGLSILVAGFGIAGMLNKGPLTSYFYRASVTFRGDYWRAAWQMFIHHPWFGVGLDRYGAYFREYRDSTQSLRRGPDLVSNAAHNIPLQLASTGGIFVLLTFLFFLGFIFWRGIVALKNSRGTEQILVSVIFGAWLAYQAQSMISIDNLAIAIWGYILGGAVVGLSLIGERGDKPVSTTSQIQPFLSIIIMLIPITISALLFQSELAMLKVQRIKFPQLQQSQWPAYESFAGKPLSYKIVEPSFQGIVASYYAQLGDLTKASLLLQNLTKSDPRNFGYNEVLAEIYEAQKNYGSAIKIREIMAKLDPYNQGLLLKLGQDYKLVGDGSSARSIIKRIDAFAPNSAEAKQAHIDFGK